MTILDHIAAIPEPAKGERILELVDEYLRHLPDNARKAFLSDVTRGYCQHCGCSDPLGACQCWKDE